MKRFLAGCVMAALLSISVSSICADTTYEPAERLIEGVAPLGGRVLLEEVLQNNPALASLRREVQGAEAAIGGAAPLPDPQASLTSFLDGAETRVGEQRWTLGLAQDLPYPGKRPGRKLVAELRRDAAFQRLQGKALGLVGRILELLVEEAFQRRHEEILEELHHHYLQHEEIARGRLATGAVSGREAIDSQIRLTELEGEQLEVAARRQSLRIDLNRLRDRDPSTELGEGFALDDLPRLGEEDLPREVLARRVAERPELAALALEVEIAEQRRVLAELGKKPDFGVGLTWTQVDRRDDEAGRSLPPAGNGRDVVGLIGRVRWPVYRASKEAAILQAEAQVQVAQEQLRALGTDLRSQVAELAARLPLENRRLELLESVLLPQLEYDRRVAEAAYTAGRSGASELLAADHRLLAGRLDVARAQAAYAKTLAGLWGAVGEAILVPQEGSAP